MAVGAGGNGVFRVGAMEEALTKSFAPESVANIPINTSGLASDIHADVRGHARASVGALYELMAHNIRPRDIMTRKAFENAITVVIALGGDPPPEASQSSGVWDVDSIDFIRVLKRLNDGVDFAGNPIGGHTDFWVAAAAHPTGSNGAARGGGRADETTVSGLEPGTGGP